MLKKGIFLKNIPLILYMIFFSMPLYAFQTNYTSINPGTIWLANDSVHIDCHGGNIIYSSEKKRYYWYGEHYANPAGVACYSSKDFYNWTNEGVVLKKGVIQVCERPKVIYSPSIKKYVMWFHYDNSSYTLAHIAVATADSATGQFTMLNHFLINGHESRDIGMFTDSTGKAYIIYSADHTNLSIRVVELTSDYTNITTKDVDTKAHCEGPGVCKYKENYCMILSPCLGWAPGQATWYTSTNIQGTWTSKGDPCIGDNSHNTFNSQSCYVFKIPGYIDAYMYMGDRWNGSGNKNSQYVFLPIKFSSNGALQLNYSANWKLENTFTVDPIVPTIKAEKEFPNTINGQNDKNYSIYNISGRKLSNKKFNSLSNNSSLQNTGLYIIAGNKGNTHLKYLVCP